MTSSGVHANSPAGPDLLGVGAPASPCGRPARAYCLRSRRKEIHRPRWFDTVSAIIAGHDLPVASRDPTMFSLSGYVKIPVLYVKIPVFSWRRRTVLAPAVWP